MSNKHYHILAMAAWGIKIFSHLFVTTPVVHSVLNGFSLGVVCICYVTILIKQRQEKNEATSR
jgi:hypothetical protein